VLVINIAALMNENLKFLTHWLNYNKLKLNIDKNDISLQIADQKIERVDKMKYLGVMLDDGLKFDDHEDFICKKMGRKYGFMCRANRKLSTESKILLYKPIVSSQINYCSSLLFLIHNEQMLRLQKIIQIKMKWQQHHLHTGNTSTPHKIHKQHSLTKHDNDKTKSQNSIFYKGIRHASLQQSQHGSKTISYGQRI
jgi:hypothetical protein